MKPTTFAAMLVTLPTWKMTGSLECAAFVAGVLPPVVLNATRSPRPRFCTVEKRAVPTCVLESKVTWLNVATFGDSPPEPPKKIGANQASRKELVTFTRKAELGKSMALLA